MGVARLYHRVRALIHRLLRLCR